MIRLIFFVTITFCITMVKAQNYCDCDSIKYKKEFNGYCNEYLNEGLRTVKKSKAQFKMYVNYEKGNPLEIYPLYYESRGSTRNTYNNTEMIKTDSIQLLNGLVESFNSLGVKISATRFKDGKIIKNVNYNYGIFRSKKSIGKQVHEIAEYYYTSGKIDAYIVKYKFNGNMIYNIHAYKNSNGKWSYDESTTLISIDPMILCK